MRGIKPLLLENIRVAVRSIRANAIRSTLTIFIIAFGIMALVGILTAIDAIKSTLTREFSLMGANSFAIVRRDMQVQQVGRQQRKINDPNITYQQARSFKERFTFPAIVSISAHVSGMTTIKFGSQKTNPNVDVWGVDENDVLTSGREIEKGRNFTSDEIATAKHVTIIGAEVARKLFKTNIDPVGQYINIANGKYRVIGVFKEKGSSFGGWDRICLIPITNARQYFPTPDQSYRISIKPYDPQLYEIAMQEAEGLFRIIRRLKPFEESDFALQASNSLSQMLINNIRLVTLAATLIGIITLFGAAIGLMNIMLVSVTERTTEIGIRKAIGARASTILQQFLIEAILIGQLGGVVGILLGIGIGNMVSLIMGGKFIIPWLWIGMGVLLCMLVSLVSGFVPARKAARVDPIVSLRYE
ncbi:MAG TPA: ABC transporter permease [Bacteroidales bacterium]|nr:ABC transporter permease [Bacteroidales bacterium]